MERLLSKSIQKSAPNVTKEDIKKIILAYEKWKVEERENYCEVCGIMLTDSERHKTDMKCFSFCCNKHWEYRMAYNMERARRELGIKKIDYRDI